MIVSMNECFTFCKKICQVLTILHQLICRGVANFGTLLGKCVCHSAADNVRRPTVSHLASVAPRSSLGLCP